MSEIYAILLDTRQGGCGSEKYCVTFDGTLAECRALCGSTHNGCDIGWAKADWRSHWIQDCAMLNSNGHSEAGHIARMERRR